jgi:hypothetical protein
MDTYIVNIENPQKSKSFLELLKELKYISSFSKADEENILNPSSWVCPGRAFTDGELEQLCAMMEEDEERYSSSELLDEVDSWK